MRFVLGLATRNKQFGFTTTTTAHPPPGPIYRDGIGLADTPSPGVLFGHEPITYTYMTCRTYSAGLLGLPRD